MKGFKRIILVVILVLTLPASALAKADLVIATDAPPKSMNPHAYSSDGLLPSGAATGQVSELSTMRAGSSAQSGRAETKSTNRITRRINSSTQYKGV